MLDGLSAKGARRDGRFKAFLRLQHAALLAVLLVALARDALAFGIDVDDLRDALIAVRSAGSDSVRLISSSRCDGGAAASPSRIITRSWRGRSA